MCTYAIALEWKERAFIEKVNSRWFCWFTAAIFVYQKYTQTWWRLHTKLYKRAWNVSVSNSETVGHKDLRLEQIVYTLVFITFVLLASSTGRFPIYFFALCLLRDSENDLQVLNFYEEGYCCWLQEIAINGIFFMSFIKGIYSPKQKKVNS